LHVVVRGASARALGREEGGGACGRVLAAKMAAIGCACELCVCGGG